MEFKGTKGNWEVFKKDIFGDVDNYQSIRAGSGYYDDKDPQIGFNLTGFASKENALLISKAPEMLEMLKDLLESWEVGNFENQQFVFVKQLIKEATEIN